MTGKILGNGFISGSDGNRYHFTSNEIVNLEGRDIDKLSGAEVDFIVKDGNASEIFITKGAGLNIDTQNIQQNLSAIGSKLASSDLMGVKIKVFIAIGLLFIAYFLENKASIALGIISGVFLIWASFIIKNLSNSKSIFLNTILIYVFAVLTFYALRYSLEELSMAVWSGKYTKMYIYLALSGLFFGLFFESIRRYCSELSILTSQWLFKISSYIAAVLALLVFIALISALFKSTYLLEKIFFVDDFNFYSFIADVLLLGFVISFVVAWVQTKEIKKLENL